MSAPSPAELGRFVSTFLYSREAFLIDEVLRIEAETGEIEARMDTTRPLPVARFQVGDHAVHPRHVSAPDLVLQSTRPRTRSGCLLQSANAT